MRNLFNFSQGRVAVLYYHLLSSNADHDISTTLTSTIHNCAFDSLVRFFDNLLVFLYIYKALRPLSEGKLKEGINPLFC